MTSMATRGAFRRLIYASGQFTKSVAKDMVTDAISSFILDEMGLTPSDSQQKAISLRGFHKSKNKKHLLASMATSQAISAFKEPLVAKALAPPQAFKSLEISTLAHENIHATQQGVVVHAITQLLVPISFQEVHRRKTSSTLFDNFKQFDNDLMVQVAAQNKEDLNLEKDPNVEEVVDEEPTETQTQELIKAYSPSKPSKSND